MSKFKDGDKVVRVGGDYMNVKRGEHYTVSKIDMDGSLKLSEIDGWYDDVFFQLAKEEQMTQQFKNMKFDVAAIAKELGKSREEVCYIVQKQLVDMGYTWSVFILPERFNANIANYIYSSYCGLITWSTNEKLYKQHKSHTIQHSFSIVPVEQEEFVELNGKKYNKKELEAALSMLKPVEE